MVITLIHPTWKFSINVLEYFYQHDKNVKFSIFTNILLFLLTLPVLFSFGLVRLSTQLWIEAEETQQKSKHKLRSVVDFYRNKNKCHITTSPLSIGNCKLILDLCLNSNFEFCRREISHIMTTWAVLTHYRTRAINIYSSLVTTCNRLSFCPSVSRGYSLFFRNLATKFIGT